MPVFNGGSLLQRSLQSIVDQTIADFYDLELFLVDNNSTDNSILQATTFLFQHKKKISYDFLRCEAKGIVPALNTGLYRILGEQKKFDFIARLDADDKWHPKKLENQLDFLRKNPHTHICGTQICRVDPQGIPLVDQFKYPTSDTDIKARLLNGDNALAHPSVVIRPEVFLRTGGYDNTYPIAEDYHLWLKALKWYNFANLDEVLMDYTVTHNPKYNPLTPKYCMLAMKQAYQRLHPVEENDSQK